MKKTFLPLYYAFVLLLCSCVGTIEDTSQRVDQTIIFDPKNITFEGVESAEAISHQRVTLFFRPASGGSGVFNYLVYVDGNTFEPKGSLDQKKAEPNSLGFLAITVKNLERGKTYSFNVQAEDVNSGFKDGNSKKIVATTFDYEVPIFDGLKSIDTIAGIDGQTKLTLNWSKAVASSTSSDFFGVDVNKIGGYNIYFGQSINTMELVASISNENTVSYTQENLIPNTAYYALVRSFNKADPPLEEKNQMILSRRTQSSASISFSGLSSATAPNSSLGFYNVNLTWPQGTGDYDRYRIFLDVAGASVRTSFNPLTETGLQLGADIFDLSLTSFRIPVTFPHKEYDVAIVACYLASCQQFSGNQKVIRVKTSPDVASFAGIKTISAPSSSDGVNSVDLVWDLPSTVGHYNEIRVFFSDSNGVYNPLTDQVGPFQNTGPGYVAALLTPTSMRITGLAIDQEHCFVAKAYSSSPIDPSNPNGRTHSNEVVKCFMLGYQYPVFLGVTGCGLRTATTVDLSWNIPNPLGILSSYQVFYNRRIV